MNPVPPHDLDAERAVLAAVLLDDGALPALLDLIRPDDFYLDAHRVIFGVMLSLFADDKPIDLVTLADRLVVAGKLEAVGGPAAISALGGLVSTAANVAHWAGIVKEKARLRGLIAAGSDMVKRAFSQADDSEKLLASVHAELVNLMARRGRDEFKAAGDFSDALVRTLEEVDAGEQQHPGLKVGLPPDELTHGHRPGDLVILSGVPSAGKTALAIQYALHVSLVSGKRVPFFSIDQSAAEIMERMVSQLSGVSLNKFRRMKFDGFDWPRIKEARDRIKKAPLWIDGRSHQTPATIRARCQAVGAEFVVIDLLQRIRGHEEVRNMNDRVGERIQDIKELAKDLQCPVYLLAHLNRAQSYRSKEDRAPRLSDLRDSGVAEGEANMVMILHRPDEKNRERVDLHVLKQKQGPTGVVPLIFDAQHCLFGLEPKYKAQMELW